MSALAARAEALAYYAVAFCVAALVLSWSAVVVCIAVKAYVDVLCFMLSLVL